MDKRAVVVIGVILLLPLGLLGVWALQGESMEGDFAEALRTGTVNGMHRDLREKQWSHDELATIQVLKVPVGAGRERALVHAIQSLGRIFVSSNMYEYQGTVRDSTTGIVHVFGYRRLDPRQWCWVRFHPDSMQKHLQRRKEQLKEMRRRAAQQHQKQPENP